MDEISPNFFQTSEHRQLALPEGLEGGRAERHSAEHLRQDHPVHRPGEARLLDEGDRL